MEEEGGSRASSRVEESLESRDNPFLPGGDLSREAEDLLSKATIIRDKFFLEQEKQKLLAESEREYTPYNATESRHDEVDGSLPNSNSTVLEERISPMSASPAQAEPQPRENGKTVEEVTSETSPDNVTVEVGGTSPLVDGSPVVKTDTDAEQQDKDKRRPKCCVLM